MVVIVGIISLIVVGIGVVEPVDIASGSAVTVGINSVGVEVLAVIGIVGVAVSSVFSFSSLSTSFSLFSSSSSSAVSPSSDLKNFVLYLEHV